MGVLGRGSGDLGEGAALGPEIACGHCWRLERAASVSLSQQTKGSATFRRDWHRTIALLEFSLFYGVGILSLSPPLSFLAFFLFLSFLVPRRKLCSGDWTGLWASRPGSLIL